MTVDERFEQLERKTQRLEKRNKRLTVALTMMAVVVCAVVTMAATGEKYSDFDTIIARTIFVKNDAGKMVVTLSTNVDGDGVVQAHSAKGKELVRLGATDNGGIISIYNKTGEGIVDMHADEYGNGLVGAWNRKGKGRTLKPGP